MLLILITDQSVNLISDNKAHRKYTKDTRMHKLHSDIVHKCNNTLARLHVNIKP